MRRILLVQLGTPEAPDAAHVRDFLAEFLTDPAVIDLPMWLWKPILHRIVLPLRSPKVAALYQQIWLPGGSPLRVHTEALSQGLQTRLGPSTTVSVTYSYSCPRLPCRLRHAMRELVSGAIERVDIVPLYPQYSTSTTQSIWNHVDAVEAHAPPGVRFHRFPDFYAHPAYIAALAHQIQSAESQGHPPEKYLFSFHSLPQKRIDRGDPYVQHCEATAQAVAQQMGWPPEKWGIAYQSKFGFAAWVKPATTAVLTEWAQSGVRSVSVLAPSFLADCLETLEELAIQNREAFLEAGGQAFSYIPALNATPFWIDRLSEMIQDVAPWPSTPAPTL